MRTHYVVCTSPLYLQRYQRPATPVDLSAHNCLLFSLPSFRSKWRFSSKTEKIVDVPVNGRDVTSNALALQRCACAGAGIALLPNGIVDAELKDGRLIDLFPKYSATRTNFAANIEPSFAFTTDLCRTT